MEQTIWMEQTLVLTVTLSEPDNRPFELRESRRNARKSSFPGMMRRFADG